MLNLDKNFCPPYPIAHRAAMIPIQYSISKNRPRVSDVGITVARIQAYMGLQLEKTGPKAAPVRIGAILSLLEIAEPSVLDADWFMESLASTCDHNVGNTVMKPRVTRIIPDTSCQIDGSMLTRAVETLKIKVNTKIDTPSDVAMMNGFHLDRSPRMLPVKIIGNIGNKQGAATLRIPAKSVKSSIIVFD